jgi:hypothetical protein
LFDFQEVKGIVWGAPGYGFLDPRSFAQKVRNATNGSWWMVQVQPTQANADQSCARSAPGGKNEIALENRPKTDLGRRSPPACFARSINQGGLFCRLDINHPPTAVGGIFTFCAKPIRGEVAML